VRFGVRKKSTSIVVDLVEFSVVRLALQFRVCSLSYSQIAPDVRGNNTAS
jgi:hypothetical protein